MNRGGEPLSLQLYSVYGVVRRIRIESEEILQSDISNRWTLKQSSCKHV
jgi:hypothetical protein